jgi:hypothetical protein
MMGWNQWGHGNCAQLPNLVSYHTAKEHFDKVDPIRGRAQEVRPLGRKRRYSWYQITKNTKAIQVKDDPLGQFITTYACRMYSTDCVEFFSDGKIVLNAGGWAGFTTQAFINYVVEPIGIINSHEGKWYWQVRRQGKLAESYPFPMNRGSEFVLEYRDGAMMPIDIKPEHRYTVNRKAMNAMRKKYEAIITYGKGVLNMSKEVDVLKEKEMYGVDTQMGSLLASYSANYDIYNKARNDNVLKLFKALDKYEETKDLNILYNMFLYISKNAGRYSYNTQGVRCEPAWFKEAMDKLIKFAFSSEVFVSTEQPIGVPFKDRNDKYFL